MKTRKCVDCDMMIDKLKTRCPDCIITRRRKANRDAARAKKGLVIKENVINPYFLKRGTK